MACRDFRTMILGQTTVMGTKKQDLPVIATAVRRKRDPETKLITDEVEGYAINLLAPNNGVVQTVKLPADVAPVIEQIKEALDAQKVVTVNLGGTFKAKCWAMIDPTTGRLNQGVSATATQLSIVSIKEPDEEEFFDDIDI